MRTIMALFRRSRSKVFAFLKSIVHKRILYIGCPKSLFYLRVWGTIFKPSQPVGKHTRLCGVLMYISDKENVSVLQSINRSLDLVYVMTSEALWIREVKPKITTKDEYKSPKLTMKLLMDMFFKNSILLTLL